MKKHRLKSWPAQFCSVRDGVKTAEYRKDDRGVEVGDVLVLMQYDPIRDVFINETIEVKVTHLVRGPSFDIPEGYAVFSIKLC